jgi:protein O-GlcNAc transferase
MKVISFSLWGNTPMYTIGAIENCKLSKRIYPDWSVFIYVDRTVPDDIITELKSEDANIIYMDEYNSKYNVSAKYGENTWMNGTWRYLPVLNPDVEVFISRDADSRLSEREARLVDEWMKSDKEFHILRDHHNHIKPISAGMFGMKKGNLFTIMQTELDYFYAKYNSNEHTKNINPLLKGIDEEFLTVLLYPKIKHTAMSHVSAGALYSGDIKIDPPTEDNFIGNVYYDKEAVNKGYSYKPGFKYL